MHIDSDSSRQKGQFSGANRESLLSVVFATRVIGCKRLKFAVSILLANALYSFKILTDQQVELLPGPQLFVEFISAEDYSSGMHRCSVTATLLSLLLALSVQAGTGTIDKVLPFYLDKKEKYSLSPSLFERDAYQVELRMKPELRSGMVYRVQWNVKGKPSAPLKIRLELRGIAQGNLPKQLVIEQPVQKRRWLTQWASLYLKGEDYKTFGEVTAWRVTLWEGEDLLLGSQQSFLW
jgi:hypothetical protein